MAVANLNAVWRAVETARYAGAKYCGKKEASTGRWGLDQADQRHV